MSDRLEDPEEVERLRPQLDSQCDRYGRQIEDSNRIYDMNKDVVDESQTRSWADGMQSQLDGAEDFLQGDGQNASPEAKERLNQAVYEGQKRVDEVET